MLAAPRFYPPPAVYASKRSEVMLKCQLEGDTEPLVDKKTIEIQLYSYINSLIFSRVLFGHFKTVR